MTLDELAKAIVTDRQAASKAEAHRMIRAVDTMIAAVLARGEEVRLPELGRFHTQDRAAATGRNPRTGEAVAIAARRVAKFTPGKALKERLNPVRLVPRQAGNGRAREARA